MTEFSGDQPLDSDARRTALEVIATLVNVKRVAADQLLRPAGIPEPLIRNFVNGRDAATNEPLTKRQGGALVLDELSKTGQADAAVRRLLEIASQWDSFHLSADEFKARAVVQKAREHTGALAKFDARERARHEKKKQEREFRYRNEQAVILRQQSGLLLAQFDRLAGATDPHERGYLFQDLLNRVFDLHGIPPARAFQRNERGEQIDAAFELDGWHYVVECRWRNKLADIRELDGLYGQIARSGRQTMGLFLSVNGWSEHVVHLMKQNPDKSIILMEGHDLRTVLARPLDLKVLLKAKLRSLNLEAEPYFSVTRLP